MRVNATPEMEKLREIFALYREGCHLVKDAPKEAVEAEKEYMRLFDIEYERNTDFDLL